MAVHTREFSTTDIMLPGSKEHGLQIEWGLGHQFLIHAGNGKRRFLNGEPDVPVHLPTPAVVHSMVMQTDMHNPCTRKLAAQSHDIFVSLQAHAPEAGDTSRKPHLVKYSRRYRAALMECVQDLRKAVTDSKSDPSAAEFYERQGDLFQTIELIWSLCEILFVEVIPGGIVLQKLLDWVKIHFTEGDRLAKMLLEEEEVEINEDYWNAIYIYVLQGRLNEARHLLSLHPTVQHDVHGAFGKLDELMRRMPVFSAHSRQSIAEFDMKWRHWQDLCMQCLQEQDFLSYPRLQVICKILSGNQDILEELQHLCGDWYQMLVTKLLYTTPTVKTVDIQYHAKTCLNVFRRSGQRLTLDSILLAALEYDIHQVVKMSSSSLSNWWFAAHLSDLLYHCGQLDTHQMDYGSNMREFLLLEYAATLMSHDSMWMTVVEYLDYCPEFGKHHLALFIERVPIQSERKAHKVLKVCEDRDLEEEATSICKVLGMRALQEGRLGTALSWCLRSKDASFATFLADKFLNEYCLRGSFSKLDLIDNLGTSMLVSDRLTFLGKYREFHRLYEDGSFQEAASLLLSLIAARLAPKQFMLILLTDALPLLEVDKVVFSGQQTYELLHCLQELLLWQESEEYKKEILPLKNKGHMELEKEKLELLQLGLARNLSRAILEETTKV